MKKLDKDQAAYKTIGEVAKELELINKKTGDLQTHTIRYWESQFKQIRPKTGSGNRRYYSNKDLKIITHIKFLLKVKGLTINGVKRLLNENKSEDLDAILNVDIHKKEFKSANLIKEKIKNIKKIVRELKSLKNG